MNQRRAGAALSYIRLFIQNGIALVFLPFMLRMLGQSEYGLYQVVGSLSAYLSVLDMGLSSTVTRYVARYRAHADQAGQESFVSLIAIIYAVLSAVVVLVGLVLYRYLPALFESSLTPGELSRARIMFLLLVANTALTILTNGFRGICTAYERFVFLRVQDIARILLRVAVLVVLLSLGYGAVAIVATDLVLNMLFSAIRIVYTFSRLHIRFRHHALNWSLLGEVAGFAFFIFLNAVIDQLYWKTNNIILGIFTTTALVAIYSIGNQISMLYMTFSTAISGVLLPQTVAAVENDVSGSALTDLMARTGRIQMLVLGLILSGFIVFGQDFIVLWVGPGYEVAYWVALMVMVPLSVPLVQNVGISILQAKNKHRFRAVVYLAIALLNIIVAVVLVRSMGVIGAAIGTAVGLFLGNVIVINIYYQRVIGLEVPRFFRELCHGILPVLIGVLLVGAGLDHLWSAVSWGAFLAKGAMMAAVYGAGMWIAGMNEYERGLIRGFVRLGRKHVGLSQTE